MSSTSVPFIGRKWKGTMAVGGLRADAIYHFLDDEIVLFKSASSSTKAYYQLNTVAASDLENFDPERASNVLRLDIILGGMTVSQYVCYNPAEDSLAFFSQEIDASADPSYLPPIVECEEHVFKPLPTKPRKADDDEEDDEDEKLLIPEHLRSLSVRERVLLGLRTVLRRFDMKPSMDEIMMLMQQLPVLYAFKGEDLEMLVENDEEISDVHETISEKMEVHVSEAQEAEEDEEEDETERMVREAMRQQLQNELEQERINQMSQIRVEEMKVMLEKADVLANGPVPSSSASSSSSSSSSSAASLPSSSSSVGAKKQKRKSKKFSQDLSASEDQGSKSKGKGKGAGLMVLGVLGGAAALIAGVVALRTYLLAKQHSQ